MPRCEVLFQKPEATMLVAALSFLCASVSGREAAPDQTPAAGPTVYRDGRPSTALRMEAKDLGVILKHGESPGQCDQLGARDVWVYDSGSTYYMHYDGAGPHEEPHR